MNHPVFDDSFIYLLPKIKVKKIITKDVKIIKSPATPRKKTIKRTEVYNDFN